MLCEEKQIEIIPIWTVSHNAAEAIAHAAKELEVDAVIIGATRRSALSHAAGTRGEGAHEKVTTDCHLMICN